MKKTLYILFATLFGVQCFSQTNNCDIIKSDNFRLRADSINLEFAKLQLSNYVVRLKSDSTKLQNEDDYLKQTLKIFQPIRTLSKQKVTFNLIACEGDIKVKP